MYENLIMCVDVEALESAENTLEELQKSLINIGNFTFFIIQDPGSGNIIRVSRLH